MQGHYWPVPVCVFVRVCVCESVCVCVHYFIQYVFVEVWHVALVGDWSIIIVSEVVLQCPWVVWDIQHCVQVMRQHLTQ